jgi:Family of unknown function (DUF6516)
MMELFTSKGDDGIHYIMKAERLVHRRIPVSDSSFMEIVIWRVPVAVRGSSHGLKYRLAFVVDDVCVLRYDNEAGKGDHRHVSGKEYPYDFRDIATLLSDFEEDVRRWKP